MEGEGRRWDMEFNPSKQGRRRLFESGTAIERRRRSLSAECTSGGGGRAREGVSSLSLGGFWGPPPWKFCN